MKNRFVFAMVAAFVLAVAPVMAALSDNLIREYRFDETDNGTIVDNQGNSDGNYTGNYVSGGLAGTALNGTGYFPDASDLVFNETTPFTISLWYKFVSGDPSAFSSILWHESTQGAWNNEPQLYIYPDNGNGGVGGGSETYDVIGAVSGPTVEYWDSVVNVSDGSWHNVVLHWNTTDLSFYIDGVYDGSATPTPGNFYFAIDDGWYWSLNELADSFYLDDFAIWSRDLSSAEITQLQTVHPNGDALGGGSPPVANFTANVTSGYTPLSVQFTDTSTNTPTSWAWDFENDGSIDNTSQNPVYVYSTPGTYTVNLTVSNVDGSDSEIKSSYITVNAVPVPYSTNVAVYNNSIRAPYTASNVSSSPVLYGDYYLRNSSSAWEAAGLMSGLRYYQSFDDYNASNRWYDVPAEVGKGGHTSCSFGANTVYAFMACPGTAIGKQGNAVQTYTTAYSPFWRTNLNAELNGSDSYTISFWANLSNTAGGRALIYSDQDTVSNSSAIKWYISNTGGYYMNLYFNNNVFQTTLFSNFSYFQTTNIWRHFVITHDRTANRFLVYVDGLLGANVSAGAISTITEIQPMIGGYPNGGVMDGVWDEAAVWNRDLPYSEISSLYNSGTGLFYANHEAVDASTYKWYKNGALVSGQTNRTLSSAYYGAPGALDDMVFEVTPVDAVYGSGTPVNSSIITIQGPPATTITTLATCPATVYPNELDLPSVAYGVYNFSVLALPDFTNESYSVGIMGQPVTCGYVSVNSTYRTYNCTFPIHFYQASGSYDLQVNYSSNSYIDQENVSSACTIGQLVATQRLTNTISFPGAGPGIANVESNVPVTVRNTGNVEVDLALTAYNLQGVNSPGILLNASSFKAGASLGSAVALAHGVQKNLSMSVPVGVNSTSDIRLWLTMGSTQAVQDYYSVVPWQIISLS